MVVCDVRGGCLVLCCLCWCVGGGGGVGCVGAGGGCCSGWAGLSVSSLLQAMQARKDLGAALVKKRASNGEEYVRVARTKSTGNRSLDLSWPLEEKLVELLAGAAAEERVKQTLLLMMPSFALAKPAQDVLQAVTAFKTGEVMKFAPAALQSAVEVIETVIGKLSSSTPPVLSLVSSAPLARSVFQRCAHLLRLTVEDGKIITGEDAVAHLCVKLAEDAIDAAGAAQLRTFKWLIAADKVAAVDLKLCAIDEGGVAEPLAKKAKITAAKARKTKTNIDHATANAMDMFD